MSEYSSPVGKMLGKIAGTYNGDVPEPSNELEKGLKDIAENGRESGSGGANALTLYGRMENGSLVVYIDKEYAKKKFDTYEEAYNAVTNATAIKLVYVDDTEEIQTESIAYARYCVMATGLGVRVEFTLSSNEAATIFLFGS